jgi:hypothetical protein
MPPRLTNSDRYGHVKTLAPCGEDPPTANSFSLGRVLSDDGSGRYCEPG